jgi:hypothetical protein
MACFYKNKNRAIRYIFFISERVFQNRCIENNKKGCRYYHSRIAVVKKDRLILTNNILNKKIPIQKNESGF